MIHHKTLAFYLAIYPMPGIIITLL